MELYLAEIQNQAWFWIKYPKAHPCIANKVVNVNPWRQTAVKNMEYPNSNHV